MDSKEKKVQTKAYTSVETIYSHSCKDTACSELNKALQEQSLEDSHVN